MKWYCEFVKLENFLTYTQIHLKSSGVNIHSKVSLSDYPELINEKKGEKYIITGIIEKTENNGIYLGKLMELEEDTFFVF